MDMEDTYDDDDAGSSDGKGGRTKSRRELPTGAVATLKAWLLSPEHFTHPYPTPQDQAMLMQKTGIDKKQLKNWFTNARRRIWKPMLKKQIEQGKITTGASGVPGSVPGLVIPAMPGAHPTANASMDNPHSIQAMRVHYQQAVQQQQQQQQEHSQPTTGDVYVNPAYNTATATSAQYYVTAPADTSGLHQQPASHPSSASIGTLPQLSSAVNLSKTDSHAVLMELFARDQDLVRQATESARLKAESRLLGQHHSQPQQVQSQHPMKAPNNQGLHNVPTLNSWPHFSSINSLNNLGTIPGVKSITSLSGADLATKGNLNKMGNLAQVKSMESMGKNDSYAFLEVFFGDRSSTNLSGMGGKDGKVMKTSAGGDEDNEIGLSLEDESPSHTTTNKKEAPLSIPVPSASLSAHIAQDSMIDSGTLKRAYDDALAARGLMSVSRSSEKLTDLVLPAKIQRTLSQELMNKAPPQASFMSFSYTSTPAAAAESSSSHQQYPGQQPAEPPSQAEFGMESSETDGHVTVSSATTCAICHQTNVDTQLRPCGHMFHERCLKPSFQTPMGQPKCPVDDVPIHSAVLAVPTDDSMPQKKQTDPPHQTPGWCNYSSSVSATQSQRS